MYTFSDTVNGDIQNEYTNVRTLEDYSPTHVISPAKFNNMQS